MFFFSGCLCSFSTQSKMNQSIKSKQAICQTQINQTENKGDSLLFRDLLRRNKLGNLAKMVIF